MLFSFARDGGLPAVFYYTDPRTHLPVRTVWLGVGCAMIISCAGIGSTVALFAFASVGTIALKTGGRLIWGLTEGHAYRFLANFCFYLVVFFCCSSAYVIPTFVRLTVGRKEFKPVSCLDGDFLMETRGLI